jgi:nucleotide-binding universal stress UspA family protein
MYKHILIPADGSDQAQTTVAQGIELAKEIGAQITVATISQPFHASIVEPMRARNTMEDYDRKAEVNAAMVLDQANAAARAADVICNTIHVQHESVCAAIIAVAEQKRCDLIVMALNKRHGIAAIMHESEAVQVLKHCKIPMLVI